jgi:hypothetical protein
MYWSMRADEATAQRGGGSAAACARSAWVVSAGKNSGSRQAQAGGVIAELADQYRLPEAVHRITPSNMRVKGMRLAGHPGAIARIAGAIVVVDEHVDQARSR